MLSSVAQGARKPRILLLGLNYAPERIGISVYSTGLCEALVRAGFEVQVVAAQPYYPDWRIFDGFRGWLPRRSCEQGVDIVRVPLYVPRVPGGLKRLVHHASFAFCGLPVLLWRAMRRRPDIVITVAPSLIAAPGAALVARLFRARSWLHVQDFEVGAAFATGLLQKKGLVARLALGFESAVVRSFDLVSSLSAEMCARLLAIGMRAERTFEFRNWADIGAVRPLERESGYRGRWAIDTPHVALYSGNIANKQGIEIVIEAARLLADREDLMFVICGDGPNLANLVERAAGMKTVRFHDLQPKEMLNELLGLASVHLLPQTAGAADLLLPSKLTNMLASGRPVVATALPGTGLARELQDCGVVTPPGDARAFADAIARLLDDPHRRTALGRQSRDRAIQAWDSERILAGAVARLRELLALPAR